jgi:RHS repeat-associated protein
MIEETLEFYTLDHLNSRTARLDISGIMVEKISYGPWGASNSTLYGSYSPYASFTGKLSDTSGLYNFNSRMYDPVGCRFLKEDSTRNGNDWYAYATCAPINFVDHNGRDAIIMPTPTFALPIPLSPINFDLGQLGNTGAWLDNQIKIYYMAQQTVNDVAANTARQQKEATKSFEKASINAIVSFGFSMVNMAVESTIGQQRQNLQKLILDSLARIGAMTAASITESLIEIYTTPIPITTYDSFGTPHTNSEHGVNIPISSMVAIAFDLFDYWDQSKRQGPMQHNSEIAHLGVDIITGVLAFTPAAPFAFILEIPLDIMDIANIWSPNIRASDSQRWARTAEAIATDAIEITIAIIFIFFFL